MSTDKITTDNESKSTQQRRPVDKDDRQHGSGPYQGFSDPSQLEIHRTDAENSGHSPSGPWGISHIPLASSRQSSQSGSDRMKTPSWFPAPSQASTFRPPTQQAFPSSQSWTGQEHRRNWAGPVSAPASVAQSYGVLAVQSGEGSRAYQSSAGLEQNDPAPASDRYGGYEEPPTGI